MPVIQRKGAQSSQGFGEFAQSSTAANYIEDVFSTYLYTGTGATGQTITNNVDLSTYGGMLWIKDRASSSNHCLVDTARGKTAVYNELNTNNTNAQNTGATYGVSTITTSGFSLTGARTDNNGSGETYASWTFRKQAKFFDIVTYTGNGTSQNIAHNLGSTPGCVMIKRTDSTSDWVVWHRSLSLTSTSQGLRLNSSDAFGTPAGGGVVWSSTSPMTSTTFGVGASSAGNWNTNLDTATYVAYLFAHDAGGFGSAGTDNVISCGSFTTDGSGNATVTFGYEPQFCMFKSSSGTSNWFIRDVMRGMVVDATNGPALYANLSDAESASSYHCRPNATGATFNLLPSTTYIYIAIRRGPMKTPTSGTSVFIPQSPNSSGSFPTVTTNFPVDMGIYRGDKTAVGNNFISSRLISGNYLFTTSAAGEAPDPSFQYDSNVGYLNLSGANSANWAFRRAPGFFDVVCYTGTGSATTQTHNLGVVPELIIVKRRDISGSWPVYSSALSNTEILLLNTTASKATATTYWNSTTPTSSVFSIGTNNNVNASGGTYIAYLFATVAGVSKVGSYTGTGALQTVNCGFTSGARFVLIKRTNSTGDWYLWDSARGISSGNDPYLLLNSTAANVTTTNYVDTDTTGFQVTAAAPAALNNNGGTYIFLAIA